MSLRSVADGRVARTRVTVRRVISAGSEGPAVPDAAMRELADAELLRRIADRRQEALAVLYDRFSPLLLAVTRRILGNGSDAEEVVQETFLQVWAQAGRYD